MSEQHIPTKESRIRADLADGRPGTHSDDPSQTSGNTANASSTPTSQVFVGLLGLYGLILLPILRANRLYNDDLKRALFGRTGWDSNGRPLTTLLMKLLQAYDHALVDISPLTQMGAAVVLAWTGVLIAKRFAVRSPWVAALVVFPLGAQPFFLENLSYKFDALSMALAMMFALLPFVVLSNTRRAWWLGILSIFVCLNLYQPAFNACLVFLLLEVILGQLQEQAPRALARALAFRVIQVGVAALIYEGIVGIHVNGWVKQKGAPIQGLHELPQVGTNVLNYLHYIGSSFDEQWWLYFGPVLLVLGLIPIVVGIRYATRMRHSLPAWFVPAIVISSVLLPFIAFAFALGPLLVLADPPIAARVLVGVGPLLVAGLLIMEAAFRRWQRSERWILSITAMFAIGLCVIASAYGNALAAQKDFEDHIASRLADDIADLANHPISSILLDGSAGYSPETAHIVDQFPIVASLTPPYLAAEDSFHTHMFLLYYLADFTDLRLQSDTDSERLKSSLLARACESSPVHTRSAYHLYLVDDTAVVLLGSAQSQRCRSTTRK
jgi:hypothetical protein